MDEEDEELNTFILQLEKAIQQIENAEEAVYKKTPIIEQLNNISLDLTEEDE